MKSNNVVLVNRDLFAKKPRPKPSPKRNAMTIPEKKNWHKKHGSWAVKMGIVNIEK
jgi:hypothetical protein